MEILIPLLIIIIGIIASVPILRVSSTSRRHKWMTHEEAEAYCQQVEKEIGLRPYSHAELVQMEAEEKQTYNEAHATFAFWSGSNDYVDADGVRRDVGTNERV